MYPVRRMMVTGAALAAVLLCAASPARSQTFVPTPGPVDRLEPPPPPEGAPAPAEGAPAPSPAAAAGVVQLDLPAKVLSAALVLETGVVATIDPSETAVRFYPEFASGKTTCQTDRVGTSPSAILYKRYQDRGFLLVASAGENTVQLYDAVTLKRIKTFAVQGNRPAVLAAGADPASPYVYYLGERMGFRGPAVGCLSLETMLEVGGVDLYNDVTDLAVSADGQRIYGLAKNQVPRQLRVFDLRQPKEAGQAPRATPGTVVSDASIAVYADPHGRYVAHGAGLSAPGLDEAARATPVPVSAFARKTPTLFGVENDCLVAMSGTDLREIRRVPLTADAGGAAGAGGTPGAVRAAPRQGAGAAPPRRAGPPAFVYSGPGDSPRFIGNVPRWYQPMVLPDEERKVVLVVREAKVAVVPVASLQLPDEPLLGLRLKDEPVLSVGRETPLGLQPLEPATRLELESGPSGMRLEGGRLLWKPGPEDVGTHSVKVGLALDGRRRSDRFSVQVRHPSVLLPFEPNECLLSQDGTLAVVATVEHRLDPAGDPTGGRSRIALVDTRTLSVIADRTMPSALAAVAVDSHHVYAVLRDSTAFYALSRKDLSDVKRVFTPRRVDRIAAAADRLLVVTAHGAHEDWTYKVPSLELVEAEGQRTPSRHVYPLQLPAWVGDGWYYRGAIMRPDFSKASLLIHPDGFPAVPLAATYDTRAKALMSGQFSARSWGVNLKEGLEREYRTRGSGLQLVLPDYPVRVKLERNVAEDGKPNQPRPFLTQLVTRQLRDGAAGPILTLSREAPARPDAASYDETGKLMVVSAGGIIAARVYDRLYVIPTAALGAQRVPPPLQVLLPDAPLVLDRKNPTALTPKVRGGKPPYEFAVETEHQAVTLDRKTGRLTIDPKPLDAMASEAITTYTRFLASPGERHKQVAAVQRFTDRRFQELVGRPSDGPVVSVLLSLSVRDAEGQTAKLDFALLHEVPLSAYNALAAAKVVQPAARRPAPTPEMEEHARREAAEVAAGREPRPGTIPPPIPPHPSNEVIRLRQQVEELRELNRTLEERTRELEARLRARGEGDAAKPQQPGAGDGGR